MSSRTGAHDPSVRDYADSSPAKLGRNKGRAPLILLPNFVGEVSASHADGGVIGPSPAAHDPSVAEDGDTSPSYAWGGK